MIITNKKIGSKREFSQMIETITKSPSSEQSCGNWKWQFILVLRVLLLMLMSFFKEQFSSFQVLVYSYSTFFVGVIPNSKTTLSHTTEHNITYERLRVLKGPIQLGSIPKPYEFFKSILDRCNATLAVSKIIECNFMLSGSIPKQENLSISAYR